MRNSIRFLALAAITSACATAHPQPTTPVHYACDDAELTRTGDQLQVASSGRATDVQLGWVDAAGNHYLAASPEASTIEYVIPRDRHADATSRVYGGGHTDVCNAHGGYTEAIALFAGGHSMAEVATRFGLSGSDEARELVHAAMLSMTRRYYADR